MPVPDGPQFKTLYHGTGVPLDVGDTIEPRGWNHIAKANVAMATTELSEAEDHAYGGMFYHGTLFAPVLEVEPLDKDEDFSVSAKRQQHLSSKKGFKVNKVVKWVTREDTI
jgi:hypothetical protein